MAKGKVTAAEPQPNPSTRVPGKAWERYVSPEEAGWSSEELEKVRDFSDSVHFCSVMIIHDGAVVAQWGDNARRMRCHSIRKSLLSALYGIYIDRGQIDVNKTLKELEIDDEPPLTEQERTACVLDLLKAKSGIYHPAACETDLMRALRPKRGSHAPGEYFWYNNWDFNVLGTIFEQETGKKISKAFYQDIAIPLQMQDYHIFSSHYQKDPALSIHPAYLFHMTSRDLARFGLLYLRKGRWGDKQIVPKEWVETSVRSYSSKKSSERHAPFGYGYLWWACTEGPLAEYGVYSARGVGGHAIVVIPGANLVVVHRVNTLCNFGKKVFPKKPTVSHSDRIKLIKLILKAQTGKPKPNPRLVPVNEPPRIESDYQYEKDFCKKAVGRYDFRKFQRDVEMKKVDGKPLLIIRQAERACYPITPISKTKFVIEDLKLPGVFLLDESGNPKAITLNYRFNKPYTGVLKTKKK